MLLLLNNIQHFYQAAGVPVKTFCLPKLFHFSNCQAKKCWYQRASLCCWNLHPCMILTAVYLQKNVPSRKKEISSSCTDKSWNNKASREYLFVYLLLNLYTAFLSPGWLAFVYFVRHRNLLRKHIYLGSLHFTAGKIVLVLPPPQQHSSNVLWDKKEFVEFNTCTKPQINMQESSYLSAGQSFIKKQRSGKAY